MRPAAVLLAACLAAGCGSGADPGPDTTEDLREDLASEFAFSARRALEGTRFEGLGDDEVARLIVDVCNGLAGSADPDAVVLAAVEGVEAPPGAAVDDQIMAVVLAEGALAVCPADVDAADLRAWEAAPPEVRFLAAIAAVAPELDGGVTSDALLSAGGAVCSVLDGGGDPEEAVTALFADLFGIEGISVEEIAAGEAGEREGLLAGGVLGSAASFLCPDHQQAVTGYLEALAEETAG